MTAPPQVKRRRYQYSLRSLFVLMTLFAMACSWYASEMHRARRRAAELDNVFEALFRYQFKPNGAKTQHDAPAYFLRINGKDPSVEFLKRFAGHEPPVRNGSDFVIGEGISFRIGRWQWISDNKIEIGGGYFKAELCGSASRYILVRKDGKWIVQQDRVVMVI